MASPLFSTRVTTRAAGLVLWVIIALAAGVGGHFRYASERADVHARAAMDLQNVLTILRDDLVQWRLERLGDGQVLAGDVRLAASVAALIDGRDSPEATHAVRTRLADYGGYRQYDQLLVVDRDGREILQEPASGSSLPEALRPGVAAIIAGGDPGFLDFYRDGQDGGVHLALVVPMAPGAVVLRIDPDAFLHPLLARPPVSARVIETVLLRRDGPDVLVLSDASVHSRAASWLRVPMSRTGDLVVRAASGHVGLTDAYDLSGRWSIGATLPVPDAPWFLASRIEFDELDHQARQSLGPILLSVGLVGVSAWLAVMVVVFWQKARHHGREAALEAARAHAEGERARAAAVLHALLNTSSTVVYQMCEIDGVLTPTEVSENIERVTGYTARETLSPGWWQQTVWPDDLPAAIQQAGRLATEDAITHEFRLRTADGRTIWIEDQLRVVRRDGGRPVEVAGAWSDVSQRHATEALLRENERRLRLALEAAQLGMIDIDLTTGRSIVSPEYARLYGEDPERFIETLDRWRDRLHPDDRERGTRAFRRYVEGSAEAFRIEVRQRVGEGWKWILSHGEVVARDAHGRGLRFIGTAADITDLKTAQLEAQSSVRYYEALSLCNEAIVRSRDTSELFARVCEAPVRAGVATLAWVGVVDAVSERLIPVAHFGSGAAYLDHIQEVRRDDPASRCAPTWRSLREQRPCWLPDGDQSLDTEPCAGINDAFGWRASAALPLQPEGRTVGVLTLHSSTADTFTGVERRLLTEMADNVRFALEGLAREEARVAMERALQDSEHRYRTLFEESGIPLLLVDPDTAAIVDVNAAAVALYGWSADKMRRMSLADINTLSPQAVRADLALTRSERKRHVVFRHRTAAGVVLDVEAYGSAMRVDQRDLVLATVIDVTDRRVAEERLRVSEASLRESLRVQDALLKEVHHRVKNNLQVITSLMRLEAARRSDPAVTSVLGEMQSRIQSMALLHETLYRAENFAEIDLAAYLSQLADRVMRSLAGSAHRVGLRLDMAPTTISLERAVPCGLLLNELVTNALKHGFPDGRSGEIRVSLHPDGDGSLVALTVADTGVGLPADWEQRRDTSLGLQLVSDLVRQLFGTLTIDAGPGARFTVRFPADGPASKEHLS